MKTITTFKDLSLKSGESIPKGTKLEFVRPGDVISVGIWMMGEREVKMRYRSVIKEPSMRALEKWSEDGVCKSVFGARVEFDGTGPLGEPSWGLALGMV